MHELLDRSEGNAVGFRVSGTLRREDYDDMTAFLEERIEQYGEVRVLFEMDPGFDGWTPSALWEDVTFDVKHNRQMTRAAMVGSGAAWEKAMTKLSRPFAHAEVRYFDRPEREEAWRWLCAENATDD